MIKYIAYCRKSTDEKGKQVLSIEQQLAELEEFAKREKLEVVDCLTEAKTAKVPGRKVFNSLIKLIEKGYANGILAWHPDRLARNTIDGGKIVYLLDTGNLQSLKFPSFWFENTPQGRFMLNIAFGQAKYFVDNLSENVKRGLRYKLQQGEWPTKAPFGYRNDKVNKTVIVDPMKSGLVKRIYKKFSTGKYNIADMVRYLEKGFETTKRILTNPFYLGLMRYDCQIYEGKHKPLVTKKIFDKVQEVINQKVAPKLHIHNFAFTSLINCGECGSAITAEKHTKFYKRTRRKVAYVYYRCTKKKSKCSQRYIREEELERQVKKIMRKIGLSRYWAANWLKNMEEDSRIEKQKSQQELMKLRIGLKELDERLDKLLEGYLDQIIDSTTYQKKRSEIVEQQFVLKSKIKEIQQKGNLWLEPFQEFVNCALLAQKIAKAKKKSDELRSIAQKVGSNYFLLAQRLNFKYKKPFDLLAARTFAASPSVMCR